MLIQLDKHSGIPVYRQIMEQVTRLIMSGHLREGDQLESVASLAKRVGVNPMTISKAYSYLVEEDLIERRPGVGLFVKPVRADIKDDVKNSLLDEAMGRAADLALQLGLGAEEAERVFSKYYQRYQSNREPASVQREERKK